MYITVHGRDTAVWNSFIMDNRVYANELLNPHNNTNSKYYNLLFP